MAADYPKAEAYFRRAIADRRALSGPLHPDVADGLNSLGAIAYMRGDEAAAETSFAGALALRQQVLGAGHPIVGMTMNNLARIKLERRKFKEAQTLLEKARAIVLAQNDPDIADMTFVYASLGVAAREMHEFDRAQQEFDRALQTATMRHHRLEGPILVDLADLECQTGRTAPALADIVRARPLIAKAYPNDPWRMALADSVEGGCLLADGHAGKAAPLIEQSLPILIKKWGEQGIYGFDARQRMRELERKRAA
jgi:Tfp pilus assembly protein PilF